MDGLPNDKILAIIPVDDPSPVAFMNLYDAGDLWVKVQGCEACESERAARCCGRCPHRYSKGCDWHHERGRYKQKPFHCVVLPIPIACKKGCAIVYECIGGANKGKRRHVTDARDVLR